MEPEYEPEYVPTPERRSYEDLQRPGPVYFEASWRPSCDRLADATNGSVVTADGRFPSGGVAMLAVPRMKTLRSA